MCASLDQITVKIWILVPNNPQKSPKSFWVPKIFGDLNQNSVNKISAKSSYLAILKIACKILKNGGGVGKNVKSIFAKSRTEILAILGIFEGYLELESIF